MDEFKQKIYKKLVKLPFPSSNSKITTNFNKEGINLSKLPCLGYKIYRCQEINKINVV